MRAPSGTLMARLGWISLPLTVGPALGAALDPSSRAVELTGATVAWISWVGVLVAVLVPRTISLTVLRIAAPVVLGAALWAGFEGDTSTADLVAVTWAAATTVVALAPSTGEEFVNGSAYGDERRMPLRAPAALLAGPVLLAWLAVVAPLVASPLLAAAGEAVGAVLVVLVGLPIAWLCARALHGLARRWVVFVPAGLVLHDPMTLADPVLFPRATIGGLAPAPGGTDALDLTRGALGLALELALAAPPVEIAMRTGRRGTTAAVKVEHLLFSPTRPGALLGEARRRRIPVNAAY